MTTLIQNQSYKSILYHMINNKTLQKTMGDMSLTLYIYKVILALGREGERMEDKGKLWK